MRLVAALTLLLSMSAGCGGGGGVEDRSPLTDLRAWAIQLQGVEHPRAVDRLVAAEVDLVVLESTNTVEGQEEFPIRGVVSRIRRSPGLALERKLCLAYLNVGQAEDYRLYWGPDWQAPAIDCKGFPGFLLAADPDGWAGNWPVAFWDPRWREILFEGPQSMLDRLLEAGFDGVMLDWVTGWTHPEVAASAEAAGLDPAEAMADLIRDLSARARARRPGFRVLLNDGAPLLARVPDLADVVDGIVRESVSFAGHASGVWDDPKNADEPVPWTDEILASLLAVRRRGVAVFTLDYASRPGTRDHAERTSRRHGFIPAVSRTPLDRLPD